MLLCRISAVSQTVARWGPSAWSGALLHRALSFNTSSCQNVSSTEGTVQSAAAQGAGPILKDIQNRFEMLRGKQVHYVPGWV
ncbi:unnamed protein product [Coregonus sp. 'balchen']|nr:unnamed protein product [Coregonus sp. 'balchen']